MMPGGVQIQKSALAHRSSLITSRPWRESTRSNVREGWGARDDERLAVPNERRCHSCHGSCMRERRGNGE
eukprot:6558894-Pyramimonas_sp.AAC.1